MRRHIFTLRVDEKLFFFFVTTLKSVLDQNYYLTIGASGSLLESFLIFFFHNVYITKLQNFNK